MIPGVNYHPALRFAPGDEDAVKRWSVLHGAVSRERYVKSQQSQSSTVHARPEEPPAQEQWGEEQKRRPTIQFAQRFVAIDSSRIVRCDFKFHLDLYGRRTSKSKATAVPDETAPGSDQATWFDRPQNVGTGEEG